MILIKMAENCGSDVYGALLFSRRSTAIGMRARVEITAHFEGKDFQKQTENLTQLLVPRRMLRGDWFPQDYCPLRDFAQKAKSRGGTLETRAYIKESTYS